MSESDIKLLTSQIDYLEKLLEGYRARFAKGDKSVEAKLRVTAAKLEELKLKFAYQKQEEDRKKKRLFSPLASLASLKKRCCGRG